MNETVLPAVRGDDNIWDFDVTGDLDPGDTITFRAARRVADLTDANALIVKTRGSGISDVDTTAGKFQVHLLPADTSSLTTDEALVFHTVLRKADVGADTTVAQGVLRF